MLANLENATVATGLEKLSFHSNPKEQYAKECSKYFITALISHSSKVMLKIFQARLQYYMISEFPDAQAGFRKGRGARDGSSKKQEISPKTSTSALLSMSKFLTLWVITHCGKFLKR